MNVTIPIVCAAIAASAFVVYRALPVSETTKRLGGTTPELVHAALSRERKTLGDSHCDELGSENFWLGAACYAGYSDAEGVALAEIQDKKLHAEEHRQFNNCLKMCRDDCHAPNRCKCTGEGGFACYGASDPEPCLGQHFIGAQCVGGSWVSQ